MGWCIVIHRKNNYWKKEKKTLHIFFSTTIGIKSILYKHTFLIHFPFHTHKQASRQILARTSYKTYSILCSCPQNIFSCQKPFQFTPQGLLVSVSPDSNSKQCHSPWSRPSNLLYCSTCCVTESGTTTSAPLEMPDNHCTTAETFGAMTETGFWAAWQQPPHMHQNSPPWCCGWLASKAPATPTVQTLTSEHTCNGVKS